jgi:dissimilatory sulfite reductase beta subunit
VNNERCMFCGNCYTMCPAMPLADKEGDGIVIMAGGKVSNRISAPKFSKVVVAFIPNEAPRWPTTAKVIKNMIEVYAKMPVNTSVWAIGRRESDGNASSRNAKSNSPII